MEQYLVLVVDDDERFRGCVVAALRARGYAVSTAVNGLEAVEHVKNREPDLVLLDVVMPWMDGYATLEELRTFSSVPVIMVSARGTAADKIAGLGHGADDYISKPFATDELIARIEALRRRISPACGSPGEENFIMGDVKVDFRRYRVMVDGKEQFLTRIEWLLLGELVRNRGRLMTHETLLSRVWGPGYAVDTQLLRTWMSRLRSKLKTRSGTDVVTTVPRVGYMIPELDGASVSASGHSLSATWSPWVNLKHFGIGARS